MRRDENPHRAVRRGRLPPDFRLDKTFRLDSFSHRKRRERLRNPSDRRGFAVSSKARLEKFLREKKVKVFTEKDFDFPKDEKKQKKIRAEVDEFMRIREEWREEDKRLLREREK